MHVSKLKELITTHQVSGKIQECNIKTLSRECGEPLMLAPSTVSLLVNHQLAFSLCFLAKCLPLFFLQCTQKSEDQLLHLADTVFITLSSLKLKGADGTLTLQRLVLTFMWDETILLQAMWP